VLLRFRPKLELPYVCVLCLDPVTGTLSQRVQGSGSWVARQHAGCLPLRPVPWVLSFGMRASRQSVHRGWHSSDTALNCVRKIRGLDGPKGLGILSVDARSPRRVPVRLTETAQAEGGGPSRRNPTWVPRSLFWRSPASRGRPWGSNWKGFSQLSPSRSRVGVDNDPPCGLSGRDHVCIDNDHPRRKTPSGPCQAK
jgi:hypothetical protein